MAAIVVTGSKPLNAKEQNTPGRYSGGTVGWRGGLRNEEGGLDLFSPLPKPGVLID